jgi:hypothetical protein
MHTPRLLTRLVLTAALAAAAGVSSVRAANYYWDIDGPSLTNTMDAPSGTWDGVTNVWNSFLQGSNGNFLAVLGETNTAVFSASPFATNAYTVTVTGTQITEAVFVEDGILTLDGGAIQFAASSSSTDTKSYIRTTTGTRGTVMVNSEIRVLNTNATTSLLKLIAGAGSGAVDLSINGPISVVVPANKFLLRPGGAGVGRIASNIGTNLTSIQADTGQRMEATWTVAGTQTLGTANVILPSASTATVGVNGKLVMGDSTNDVQAWGGTTHNNTNGMIVINSTATLGGNIDIGAGTNVTINGHARFTGIANVVQWTWTNGVYTNRFTVSDGGSLTLKIGTTTTGSYGRFAKFNNAFTNVVLALNGGLGFDLTSASLVNGNVWQILRHQLLGGGLHPRPHEQHLDLCRRVHQHLDVPEELRHP